MPWLRIYQVGYIALFLLSTGGLSTLSYYFCVFLEALRAEVITLSCHNVASNTTEISLAQALLNSTNSGNLTDTMSAEPNLIFPLSIDQEWLLILFITACVIGITLTSFVLGCFGKYLFCNRELSLEQECLRLRSERNQLGQGIPSLISPIFNSHSNNSNYGTAPTLGDLENNDIKRAIQQSLQDQKNSKGNTSSSTPLLISGP